MVKDIVCFSNEDSEGVGLKLNRAETLPASAHHLTIPILKDNRPAGDSRTSLHTRD